MIFVWIEKVRKVTARGSRCHEVKCESCDGTFTYDVHREVTAEDGSLFSWTEEAAYKKAEANAAALLDKELNEVETVLCPYCGWVQGSMIEAVRQRSYPTLRQLARLGMLFTVTGFLLGVVFLVVMWFGGWGGPVGPQHPALSMVAVGVMIGTVAGIGTFVSWITRRALNAAYNPNRHPPLRPVPDDERNPAA